MNTEPKIEWVDSDNSAPVDSSNSTEFTAAADIVRANRFTSDDFKKFLYRQEHFHYTKHEFVVEKRINPARGQLQIYVLNSEVPAITAAYIAARARQNQRNAERRRDEINGITRHYTHDELVEIHAQLKVYFRQQRCNARAVNSGLVP